MLDVGRVLERSEVALDWYSRVYLPSVDVIDAQLLDAVCPGATPSDRFLWAHQQRRELSVEHGAQELPEVIDLAESPIGAEEGAGSSGRTDQEGEDDD